MSMTGITGRTGLRARMEDSSGISGTYFRHACLRRRGVAAARPGRRWRTG
jgi:hypothetical protein